MRILLVLFICVFAMPFILIEGYIDTFHCGELGYDACECRRLETLVENDRLREQLIHWVDNELDLQALKWSETEVKSERGDHWPGERAIQEPGFDFSLLKMGPEYDEFSLPQVRLVTPYHGHEDHGNNRVFGATSSVVFLQATRVAVLVRVKNSEDFGVDHRHFKQTYGRVAVYCKSRD